MTSRETLPAPTIPDVPGRRAGAYGALLCAAAAALSVYALLTFLWRQKHLRQHDKVEWGDPQGPLLVAAVVIFLLVCVFIAETRVWLAA